MPAACCEHVMGCCTRMAAGARVAVGAGEEGGGVVGRNGAPMCFPGVFRVFLHACADVAGVRSVRETLELVYSGACLCVGVHTQVCEGLEKGRTLGSVRTFNSVVVAMQLVGGGGVLSSGTRGEVRL